jgi:hypothetical protein
MWTKRPKPGGKGLRCKIIIARRLGSILCDRPARRYLCSKNGYDLGAIDCRTNHCAAHERQGITMTLVDRRRKAAA